MNGLIRILKKILLNNLNSIEFLLGDVTSIKGYFDIVLA